MDTQRHEDEMNEEQSIQNRNADSNGGSNKERKGGIHNNALYAAGMGRPATAQVDPHNSEGLADTGTNISYEGPTAPGAGGSAGRGYTSGQPDTGATINTSSDFDQAAVGKHLEKTEGDDDIDDTQNR